MSFVVKLNNIIGEKNHFLRLKKQPETKTYKNINKNTKKIDKVSIRNFQKLFDGGELKWADEKYEYSLFINNGKLIQLLTTK